MSSGSKKLNKAQAKAKEYVDQHKIEKLISEMVNSLVHTRDKKPLVYMIKYLANQCTKEDLEASGISVDGPLPQRIPLMNFPEFSDECTSLLKAHMTKEVWSAMKKRATHLGGKIQLCVQCGVNDESDPVGIYATDEEAYKTFDDLFLPIIQDLHPDYDTKVNYRNEFELVSVPNFQRLTRLKVSVRRNFKEFPFTPMMSTESKLRVEKKVGEILGEVTGEYHTISKIDDETKAWLTSEGIDINRQPSHDFAGINEDWPNGRGVFIENNKEYVVLVNFEDHVQIITICNGGDYNKSLLSLTKLLSKFEKIGYARHTTLGFLTASPKNLGTALHIESRIKLPKAHDSDDIESYEGTYSCKINKFDGNEYEINFYKTLAKNLTENEAFNEFGECIKRLTENEPQQEEEKQPEPEVKVDNTEPPASAEPTESRNEQPVDASGDENKPAETKPELVDTKEPEKPAETEAPKEDSKSEQEPEKQESEPQAQPQPETEDVKQDEPVENAEPEAKPDEGDEKAEDKVDEPAAETNEDAKEDKQDEGEKAD